VLRYPDLTLNIKQCSPTGYKKAEDLSHKNRSLNDVEGNVRYLFWEPK